MKKHGSGTIMLLGKEDAQSLIHGGKRVKCCTPLIIELPFLSMYLIFRLWQLDSNHQQQSPTEK